MMILKVGDRDYKVKFTTRAIESLNKKGITLTTLGDAVSKMDMVMYVDALLEGLQFAHKGTKRNDVYDILDELSEDEEYDFQTTFMDLTEEMARAMGLGKMFKENVANQA